MLIDQITPHLPKDNDEVNRHVKRLQAMLDTTTVANLVHDQEYEDQVHEDGHRHSPRGDLASSITPPEERSQGHGRDNRNLRDVIRSRYARDRIETNAEIGSVMSRSSTMRGTDYYGSYYDQPHRQRSLEGGHVPGGIKAYSRDLKRVRWPLNFKTSEIEKYDGSTNSTEWLEVYQLAIETVGGDSYVMVNYLSVYLSASARNLLLGLPARSVRSYNHLHELFTSNFRTTCAQPESTGT
jgi:hypothetical protein